MHTEILKSLVKIWAMVIHILLIEMLVNEYEALQA